MIRKSLDSELRGAAHNAVPSPDRPAYDASPLCGRTGSRTVTGCARWPTTWATSGRLGWWWACSAAASVRCRRCAPQNIDRPRSQNTGAEASQACSASHEFFGFLHFSPSLVRLLLSRCLPQPTLYRTRKTRLSMSATSGATEAPLTRWSTAVNPSLALIACILSFFKVVSPVPSSAHAAGQRL